MYLERLKTYGPKFECVITITEELAIKQAQQADAEIAAGKYRGPLHGVPYGAKDLLATRGYKTTWGAMPYKDQMIDEDATVIKRLEQAGAVLVAKLTMGALAWGDVWYGGKTRNPWNLEQGSSGSSAGSASATAAGLVAFAIGTETWGSIVSPSTRCGVTGLRPTYGRVSRAGAMALSWSMDKIGPICRTVEDCALVFDAISGPDGIDQTVVDLPFNYNPNVKLGQLRIGYLKDAFEKDTVNVANNEAVLAKLRELGAELIPVELPDHPVSNLSFILSAEAAAAFDELTRSGKDDLMVRQIKNAWPNVFRTSRFIPAVEYIQANRVRYLVIQAMAKMMADIDVYVAPSFGSNLLLTNLTGHPCVVVPNGFDKKGGPTSISFIGRLYDEATTLAVAKTYQDATDFHRRHPTPAL
jgi:Asp-tRNA(Asn)/Glu-tRNA(Gln) amidotransferase A subunit family amidase